LEGHNLIDVTNGTSLSFTPNESIPIGDYTNVSFTFGFTNEDNIDGEYTDLNSASWNVPAMLGGGYHYMQLEGKFVDDIATETGYQYHAIRAVDVSGVEPEFQDTFFQVDLGLVTISDTITFDISMNVAEWFKNPNQWNLNELHSLLMPNFDAQIMMFQNGENVFELDRITQ
jgi:methanobactin biosynthesis MbnP-like protein